MYLVFSIQKTFHIKSLRPQKECFHTEKFAAISILPVPSSGTLSVTPPRNMGILFPGPLPHNLFPVCGAQSGPPFIQLSSTDQPNKHAFLNHGLYIEYSLGLSTGKNYQKVLLADRPAPLTFWTIFVRFGILFYIRSGPAEIRGFFSGFGVSSCQNKTCITIHLVDIQKI